MDSHDLDLCFQFTVIDEEGGEKLSLDAHDPGNWTGNRVGKGELRGTRFGISSGAHPKLDVTKLTRDDARQIFLHEYVEPGKCDRDETGYCHVTSDCYFNAGQLSGDRIRAASDHSHPATVQDKIHDFSSSRMSTFRSFAGWKRYGVAWGARIGRCERRGLQMWLESQGISGIQQRKVVQAHADRVRKGAATHGRAAATAAPTAAVAHSLPMDGWLWGILVGALVVMAIVAGARYVAEHHRAAEIAA